MDIKKCCFEMNLLANIVIIYVSNRRIDGYQYIYIMSWTTGHKSLTHCSEEHKLWTKLKANKYRLSAYFTKPESQIS